MLRRSTVSLCAATAGVWQIQRECNSGRLSWLEKGSGKVVYDRPTSGTVLDAAPCANIANKPFPTPDMISYGNAMGTTDAWCYYHTMMASIFIFFVPYWTLGMWAHMRFYYTTASAATAAYDASHKD